jgi:hypothetical protein
MELEFDRQNLTHNREKNVNSKPELTQEQKRRKWGLSSKQLSEAIDAGLQQRETLLQKLETLKNMDDQIFGLVKELDLPVTSKTVQDGKMPKSDSLNSSFELKPGERYIRGNKDYAIIERDNIPGYPITIDKRQNLEIIQGPDENTNWHEAKAFAESINKLSGPKENNFRLPTEDELKKLYTEFKDNDNLNKVGFLPEDHRVMLWSNKKRDSESLAWYCDFNHGSGGWYRLNIALNHRCLAVRSRT